MKRVLIIEDDRILRENTEIFLKLKGFEVITADDGEDGIRFAKEKMPDVILCDITMPVVSGYEVLKALREDPVTSVIPFIFLTARAEKEDFRKGLQLGVDDYISKPFNFNELLDAIEMRMSKTENLRKAVTGQYMALMESFPAGVFIYRMNRFEYVNPLVIKALGYTVEELAAMEVTELIATKDQDAFISLVEHCCDLLPGESSREITFIGKDGSLILLALDCAINKIRWDDSIIFIARDPVVQAGSDLPAGLAEQIRGLDSETLARISGSGGNIRPVSRFAERLSSREKEILGLISNGLTTQEIGEKLFISPRTVEFHRANLMSKTSSKNVADLVKFAIRHKITEI